MSAADPKPAAGDLRQRLTDMMSVRPPEYRALLDEVTRVLRATALATIIKPGQTMPDFVLPDAEGGLVESSDLLARGPLVVVMFRGDWCPFCRETLASLDAALPAIAAAGASLVAVTLDTGDYLASDRLRQDLHFPVLSDVDGALALTLGTMFRVPDGLRAHYESIGIEIGDRHGSDIWLLPIPATIVVDRAGIVRFVHASGDITDRAEPRDIVAWARAAAVAP